MPCAVMLIEGSLGSEILFKNENYSKFKNFIAIVENLKQKIITNCFIAKNYSNFYSSNFIANLQKFKTCHLNQNKEKSNQIPKKQFKTLLNHPKQQQKKFHKNLC